MKHQTIITLCLMLLLAAGCSKDNNTGNNQQNNNSNDTAYHAANHGGSYLVTTKRYRWQYVAGDTTYFTNNDTLIVTDDNSGTLIMFSYSDAITLTRTATSATAEVYTGGGSPQRSLVYYPGKSDSISGHFKVTSTNYVIVDSFWGRRIM